MNVWTKSWSIIETNERNRGRYPAVPRQSCHKDCRLPALVHARETWEEFPLSQRWFAVGETIAHLDYLVCKGYAERKVVDGKTLTGSPWMVLCANPNWTVSGKTTARNKGKKRQKTNMAGILV